MGAGDQEWMGSERRWHGWMGRILIPLKRPRMLNDSPVALKLAYSQGLCKRHGWVTHTRIDENPAIRGHDLCFDKTCQWQPRLETWNGRHKTVQNYDRENVMSCCKKLSADWTRVLYSLYGCVWCVCVLQVRTHLIRLKTILEFGRRNPPCNAEDRSTRRIPCH